MVRLEALHILLGYPPDGTLARTTTGMLAVSWNGGAVTIDPSTGAAVAGDGAVTIAEPARDRLGQASIVTGASVTFARSRVDVVEERVMWTRTDGAEKVASPVAREVALGWDDLVLDAADEHLLLARGNELHLLDPVAGERRALSLPAAVAVDGASATGIPSLSPSRLLVGRMLVIVRTPSLLVMALDDVRVALRADRVTWSLRTAMPLADAHASEAARTPSTGRGLALGRYLTSAPPREGRGAARVHGRLWIPFGYETIDYEDGASASWHARPADASTCEEVVRTNPLWVERVDPALGRTLAHAWAPALDAVTEPDGPTAGASPLAGIALPRTGREALTLARALDVERRAGAYGPLSGATKHLRGLNSRDPEDENESRAEAYADFLVGAAWHQGTIYEGTAFLVLPLVGIVVDPKAIGREAVCSALGFFAVAAKAQGDAAAAATRFALERSVSALLVPPRGLKRLEADAWMRMLVAIGSMTEPRAPWLRRLSALDPDVARLCAELDAGTSLFDLVAAAAP